MFSHLDHHNNPAMVNITDKKNTLRFAHARAIVILPDNVLAHFHEKELHSKKGPVFQTAQLAGIMAAKRTSEFIPLCHPLPIDNVEITIFLSESKDVIIDCKVSAFYKTGVEMEALVGTTIAALTIYDMCKSFGHDIVIEEIKLIEKKGGKSDYLHT